MLQQPHDETGFIFIMRLQQRHLLPILICLFLAQTIVEASFVFARDALQQQLRRLSQPVPKSRENVSVSATSKNDDQVQDDTVKSSSSVSSSSAALILDCAILDANEALKREIIALAASFDRGFGATPAAIQSVDRLLDRLELANRDSMTTSAADLFTPTRICNNNNNNQNQPAAPQPPTPTILGKWRMIWTTAFDVLSLNLSPISKVSAIHQIYEETAVINVIDLLPRISSVLFPTQNRLRAVVTTRPNPYYNNNKNNNNSSPYPPPRIGLTFQRVELQPLEVFGWDGRSLPPLAWNLPKLPGTDSTGYFDVTFLDEDLLIIRQNAPGGRFVLLRVNDLEP